MVNASHDFSLAVVKLQLTATCAGGAQHTLNTQRTLREYCLAVVWFGFCRRFAAAVAAGCLMVVLLCCAVRAR